jgi:hypothetical protein
MDTNAKVQYLDNFETHYKYDARYLRDLLETSEEGFDKFNAFMPMSTHKQALSTEAFWVAKLSAMRAEDCGSCLQLNIRMALESGVSKPIIESVLYSKETLPTELKRVYDFATSIALNENLSSTDQTAIDEALTKSEKIEIGLCVAAARVFPTLKRAAGYSKACNLMEFEV